MQTPQQHDITHATSSPMEVSAGYGGHDTSMKELGQSDLKGKSAQSTFDIVETPMRPATTFFVPPQQQRDRRWWHRIGRPGILVLTVGTGVTLFCTSLLIFLWNGADRARSGYHRAEFWDDIVFNGWATQLVTICSAGIRVSIGFQIGLAAAAMAAVILETAGSRFCDTAMLSIQRASSSSAGPLDLLPTAWRHCLAGRVSGLLYLLVLALTVAIALISTLTSTILLFDLGEGQISAPITTTIKAVGFDIANSSAFSSIAYWRSRPLAHWRFAETRPAQMETPLRTDNAVDTGDIYRAMLPFDMASDRTTLEYYQGPAVVINQRTACFPPTFINASIQWETGMRSGISGLHLNATFAVENQIDFLGNELSKPIKIHCRLHNMWNSTKTSANSPTALCNELAMVEVSTKNVTMNPLSGWPYGFRYVTLINSGEVLNGRFESGMGKAIPDDLQKELDDLTYHTNGPWTVAHTADETEVFNITVCYISQNLPHKLNVTMSGKPVTSEPRFLTDLSSLTVIRNDTSVIRQLGVGISPDNTTGRGTLDLQVHSGPDLWMELDEELSLQSAYLELWMTLIEFSTLGGWDLAGNIVFEEDITTNVIWATHPEHAAMFQSILHETGNPAIAFQAIMFRVYQMLYYDWLPIFEPTHEVTSINAQNVVVPQQWTGFIVVTAILTTHFILTALTLVLFAKRTKSSLLGNAWQAVSQLVSPETQDIIRAAGSEGMKDRQVEALARSAGRDKEAYALASGVDSGRIELRVR
ncbi:hypothetical protein NW762_014431 [Fusarium torreyae]|uniref:Uncharacterized protein n=1 Tax=Fusarium torreyae TaxID=1237075 RepID=A0A9W8RIT7_9HYPO|nr:hypothetical protein NW762_014431 [Fusarium torreyae]